MIIKGDEFSPTAKGALSFPDGNYLLPGMSFSSEISSGLYKDGSGIGISYRGKKVGYFDIYGFSNERPGSILEQLWSPCDGSTYQLTTGNYTVQSVTTTQGLSNAFQNINGSIITYQPPSEATGVVYRFTYSNSWVTAGAGITHHTFWVGGFEVTFARHGRSTNQNQEHRYTFEWIVRIGGSSNRNTGRLNIWNTPLELKMMARNLNSGVNDGRLHGTTYWSSSDGMTGSVSTPSVQFSMPVINIVAIR